MERDKYKVTIKEGVLLKRQRGLHSLSLKKLKFQERYCMLSNKGLYYYDGEKEKGRFEVDRIKIVEAIPPAIFKKDFCIQVGDDAEVLYFVTKSKAEMEEWMHAFREAASNNDNVMLSRYHTGAYGLLSHGKWSCCNKAKRQSKGCQEVFSNRSHTLQPQGTKNTAATELATTQCRPTSFPCFVSSYPPPALPQHEALLPFPDGFRDRCHSSITKSESPRMSPLLEDSQKRATLSTMRPSKECRVEQYGLGRQHYRSTNDSDQSIAADSGLGESLPNLPKRTESLVSTSSSRLSEDYNFQSPEIGAVQTKMETEKNIGILETEKAVTALAFYGFTLLSGCQDEHVLLWDTPSSTVMKEVKVSGPVLALDVWSHYLAIGSTSVQLVDTNSKKPRRIMVIDMDSAEEEDSLEKSVLNLVAYTGSEGMLATASVTSNVVKLWDPPHADESIIRSPKDRIPLGESGKCSVWSLSASYNPESPWLAVGVCLEEQHKPLEKLVRLIDWKKPQECFYSIPADFEALHTSFSPDGKHLVIGYPTRVDIHDAMSRDLLYYSTTDSIISSLSCYLHQPGGSPKPHLAVGLTTGEVQVFELCTETMRHVYTVPRPENESAATAIVYSGDMEALAIGHQNGKIHLWKEQDLLDVLQKAPEPMSVLESKFCPDTVFTRLKRQTFDYEGGEYISEVDEFQLIIPKGAIPKSTQVTIEFGVSPYGPFGPFEYPDNYQPVSANVWFCATPPITFLKPVEIKLPHFADCRDENDCKALTYLKAQHIQKAEKVFQFSKTDGKTSFTPQISSGSLYTNHFCVYCTAEFKRYDTDNANFSLVIARPKQTSQDKPFQIHCCLTYMLPTCYRLIKEKFCEDQYNITKKIVRFADDQHTLRISLNKDDAVVKGWLVSLVSGEEIGTKEVCFWDAFKLPSSLVLACDENMYPPRFIIEVSGKDATRSSNLKLKFEGSIKVLQTEIPLELQDHRPVIPFWERDYIGLNLTSYKEPSGSY